MYNNIFASDNVSRCIVLVSALFLFRRVIVLILMMLIIIPLLTVNDPDISLSLGVQFVHELALRNLTDSATYGVSIFLCPIKCHM